MHTNKQCTQLAYNCYTALLQVANNGLLSFRRPFVSFDPVPFDSNFSAFLNPIIAPFWVDYDDVDSSGSISYRRTSDISILRNVTEVLAARNPHLQSYQPTLAFIATWNEILLIDQEVGDPYHIEVCLYPSTIIHDSYY